MAPNWTLENASDGMWWSLLYSLCMWSSDCFIFEIPQFLTHLSFTKKRVEVILDVKQCFSSWQLELSFVLALFGCTKMTGVPLCSCSSSFYFLFPLCWAAVVLHSPLLIMHLHFRVGICCCFPAVFLLLESNVNFHSWNLCLSWYVCRDHPGSREGSFL